MARSETAARAVLVALLAFTVYLLWRILLPFLPGIAWSLVLATAFHPLYRRLARLLRGREALAASLMSIILALVIVVPCAVAAMKVTEGVVQGYKWAQATFGAGGKGIDLSAAPPWARSTLERGKELVESQAIDVEGMAVSALQAAGNFLATRTAALVTNALSVVLNLVVMLICMAIFFRRGPAAIATVRSFLPLAEADRDAVIGELQTVTRAVFFGVLLTALVQGILCGIGTAIAGLPQPVTFGAATFVAAILPGGTILVWAPAAVYLLASGSPGWGLFLAAWGALIVSTSDNFVRPLFIGRGVRLPGFLIFLGTVGGMFAFGLVGLFVGPLVITFFLFLVEVLRRDPFRDVSRAS